MARTYNDRPRNDRQPIALAAKARDLKAREAFAAHMEEVDEWRKLPHFSTKVIGTAEVNGRLMVRRVGRNGHESVVLL